MKSTLTRIKRTPTTFNGASGLFGLVESNQNCVIMCSDTTEHLGQFTSSTEGGSERTQPVESGVVRGRAELHLAGNLRVPSVEKSSN